MKKYSFNKLIKTVDNSESMKLSTALRTILATANKIENPLKAYGWYVTLENSDELMLDDADKRLLYNFIETNDNIYLFVKGAILEALNNGTD
jgi:hypothetical protein